MSAVHASAAKTHAPPHAAPPLMREAAPQSRYAPPPMASLAAIPAMPVVQRACTACDQEEGDTPEIQRRPVAAAAAPAVQRACTACGPDEEDMSPVQPRLEVGPVGDRYEQEADSIAATVMAMRDPGADDASASAAGGAVQRACSACSSSDDEPRARRIASRDAEEDLKVRARRDEGAETIAASDAELTSGGSELPAATRSFFEARMGRDLGGVRVHSGGSAAAMNISISARAFTYRNHVWLGAGESASPSFTMAHELAHVMQQTSPGPIGPQRREASAGRPAVQRTYYYEEVGKSLPDTHDEVVNTLMQRDSSIFAEVPVPNYNSRGKARTKGGFGRADLISFDGSDRMVPIGMATAACSTAQKGAWYCGASADRSAFRKPNALDPQYEDVRHKDGTWNKAKMAAESIPRFGDVSGAVPKVGFVRDAGGAEKAAKPSVTNPSDTVPPAVNTALAIGDVKAGAFPHARQKAVSQIGHYMVGFKEARDHYEDIRRSVEERRAAMVAEGKNDFSALPPALTPWSLKAGFLEKINQTKNIEKLRAGGAKIILRRWESNGEGRIKGSHPVDDAQPVDGNLFLWREVGKMEGAWSYLWTPVTSEASSLHNALGADADFSLYSKEAFCLRDALSMPIDAKGKPTAIASKAPGCLKPMRLSAAPPRVRRKGGTKPAPKTPERADQFADNYKLWSEKQKKVETNFKAFQKTPAGKSRAAATAELEARQNIVDAIPQTAGGIRKDKVLSAKGEQAFKENAAAQFWIETMGGQSGRLLGQMRLRFGKLFLAVVNGYQSAKTKITDFLQKMNSAKASGGRIVRAALKIVGKILAGAANVMLPKIGQAIVQCVEDGVHKKIDSMLEDGPLALVRERIGEAQQFAGELTDAAMAKMNGFADGLLGDVTASIAKVRDAAGLIAKIVGYAKDAFDLVRIAICAAGGLESAGLACVVSLADKLLSWVNASPLELLADSILGSCYGQTLLGKAMYAVDAVRNLPKTLAAAISDKLKSVLPPAMADLLCNTDDMVKGVDLPDLAELTCGRGYSEALPGPDANGIYKPGDWVAPPGYPTPAQRKKLDKMAKDACDADPSKPGCTATPPDDPKKPDPKAPAPDQAPPVVVIPDLVPPVVGKPPVVAEPPAPEEVGKDDKTQQPAPPANGGGGPAGNDPVDVVREGVLRDKKPVAGSTEILGGFNPKRSYDGTQMSGAHVVVYGPDGMVFGPVAVTIYIFAIKKAKTGWTITYRFKTKKAGDHIIITDAATGREIEVSNPPKGTIDSPIRALPSDGKGKE